MHLPTPTVTRHERDDFLALGGAVPARGLSRDQSGDGLAIRRGPGDAGEKLRGSLASSSTYFRRSRGGDRCGGGAGGPVSGRAPLARAEGRSGGCPLCLRFLPPAAPPAYSLWRNAGWLRRPHHVVFPDGLSTRSWPHGVTGSIRNGRGRFHCWFARLAAPCSSCRHGRFGDKPRGGSRSHSGIPCRNGLCCMGGL